MIGAEGETPAPEPFHATITPHRSLGPKGFIALMAVIAGFNLAIGLTFYLKGAWPVLGFCGLDVLLLWIAFKINYRAGGASETIEIQGGAMTLTRIHADGRREAFTLNPYWVRVGFAERKDGRTYLWLQSHGRRLPFGAELTDDERREFAGLLEAELATQRSWTARA